MTVKLGLASGKPVVFVPFACRVSQVVSSSAPGEKETVEKEKEIENKGNVINCEIM